MAEDEGTGLMASPRMRGIARTASMLKHRVRTSDSVGDRALFHRCLPDSFFAFLLLLACCVVGLIPYGHYVLYAATLYAGYSLVMHFYKECTNYGSNDFRIQRGRKTATLEGDYVVFLLGLRANWAWKLTENLGYLAEALDSIEKELDTNEEIGCLGSETYLGANSNGSTTMLVQYWKSVEHLRAYASNQDNNHYPGWKKLMQIGRKTDEIGFWHETFVVHDGESESIYINCPLLHLANARGAIHKTADKTATTMKGRLKKVLKGEGGTDEWPEGFYEAQMADGDEMGADAEDATAKKGN